MIIDQCKGGGLSLEWNSSGAGLMLEGAERTRGEEEKNNKKGEKKEECSGKLNQMLTKRFFPAQKGQRANTRVSTRNPEDKEMEERNFLLNRTQTTEGALFPY